MILDVQITDNRMAANLLIKGSQEILESKLTESYLLNTIKNKGINTGIDLPAINQIISDKIFNKVIGVAQGIPPETGEDGRVKILKKSKKKKDIFPPQTEDGQVDYYSPRDGFLVYVRKGDIVATKTPQTVGKPGKDIYGNTVPGLLGKDISLELFVGLNTRISEDKIIAQHDGIVELKGHQINVLREYYINESIGKNTGSIDIPHDLDCKIVVDGDIKSGYKVACSNLLVHGCIEDATLTVKDLIVKEGIVGTGNEKIISNTIHVGYINGPREIQAHSVRVVREISNGAKVYANVVKAYAIQGSTIYGRDAIWTDYVNGKNYIAVGIDYQAKKELENLTKEIISMEEPMEELKSQRLIDTKRMKKLVELARLNPKHPLIVKELPRIKEAKIKLDNYIALRVDLIEKKEYLSQKIFSKGNHFLFVRESLGKDSSADKVVGPNITVALEDRTQKITESISGGLFCIKDHDIIRTSRYNIKEIKNQFDTYFNISLNHDDENSKAVVET